MNESSSPLSEELYYTVSSPINANVRLWNATANCSIESVENAWNKRCHFVKKAEHFIAVCIQKRLWAAAAPIGSLYQVIL